MAKTLEDYRDALVPADQSVYTHATITRDGRVFSIHKNPTDAANSANRIGGAVLPFTTNPTQYWTASIGDRYDH